MKSVRSLQLKEKERWMELPWKNKQAKKKAGSKPIYHRVRSSRNSEILSFKQGKQGLFAFISTGILLTWHDR